MIRVGVLGSRGRMGQTVIRTIQAHHSAQAVVYAQVDQTADSTDSIEKLLDSDLVIDFSAPAAMLAVATEADKRGKNLPAFVIGTTGWRLDNKRVLEALSQKAFVMMSANFSLGALAVIDAIRHLSPFLDKFKYDAVVVETHHKHKKDAPSGTAISFQRAISPTGAGNVPIQSIRIGEVVGEHEARFYGRSDEITIRHSAQDRSIFAEGALAVGFWLLERRHLSAPSGLIGVESYFQSLKEKLK